MMSHLQSLYQSLRDAESGLEAAKQADIDNQYRNHERYYSHTYLQAWDAWFDACMRWHQAIETVKLPVVKAA